MVQQDQGAADRAAQQQVAGLVFLKRARPVADDLAGGFLGERATTDVAKTLLLSMSLPPVLVRWGEGPRPPSACQAGPRVRKRLGTWHLGQNAELRGHWAG